MVYASPVNFDSYVRFRNNSNASFAGTVDFTGANVTGLSIIAEFG
jgi:hypothetical protein